MKRKIELLAPGGDVDAIKAAILAGADAVYCGLNHFNARDRATNIEFEDLNGIITLAHQNTCKVFLTLNIIILESEIPTLVRLLNKLTRTKIDGIIVQDLGLFYILSTYFKSLEIHASTQCTIHNKGQIKFLSRLGATRVNLSRELNINEIKALTPVGHDHNILTEVFVHGSYCIGFSGVCYMSSVHKGKSGNRGRCSQPCRDKYLTTPAGKSFPLNLKDNSAFFDLEALFEAGVDSIKIEGRMKNFDYVYTVVKSYKKQIQNFYNQKIQSKDNSDLYKVFNRDFSNAYLKGDIHENMFIDNPRDYSIKRFSGIDDDSADKKLVKEKEKYYAEKESIFSDVKSKIELLSIDDIPLQIIVSGRLDKPLKISLISTTNSFNIVSETNLRHSDKHPLNYSDIIKRLNVINKMGYCISNLDIEGLEQNLFLPFKELTAIIKRIIFILNGSKEIIDPIDIPLIKKQKSLEVKPSLSVLISSKKDLHLCNETSSNIFFKLPDCFENKLVEFIDLFSENNKIIPWFPSVLIGTEYDAAKEFLSQVQPKLIVTNNTGIAYEAYKQGISWIAGPYLNIVNSFSLLCLKENFNCYGAFVSNEINKNQIRSIKRSEDFKLYYTVYNPVVLMTSRQCLFHQVTGCKKNAIDATCIEECDRSSSIASLNDNPIFINKTKGDYHCIYNNKNFLNTDIVNDFPGFFTGFCIDLRDIRTETMVKTDKLSLVKLFEGFLDGGSDSKHKLKQIISPSTNAQYKKGI
jgi:U32 family peptidase